MTDILLTGVVAGVFGTLAMDSLNYFFARTGMLIRIDVRIIGRMAAGWTHGCFRYAQPGEMKQVENERFYGWITHHLIGVALAIPFILGWDFFVGGAVSLVWALTYGVATTVASYFFMYPSMGLGVFGRKSPEGIRAAISSLANHLFYGMGLAFGIILT